MVDDELEIHIHTAFAVQKANQMLGVIKPIYVNKDAFMTSDGNKENNFDR